VNEWDINGTECWTIRLWTVVTLTAFIMTFKIKLCVCIIDGSKSSSETLIQQDAEIFVVCVYVFLNGYV
jgi:hypothetical protein